MRIFFSERSGRSQWPLQSLFLLTGSVARCGRSPVSSGTAACPWGKRALPAGSEYDAIQHSCWSPKHPGSWAGHVFYVQGRRCRDLTKAGARASDLFNLCLFSLASLFDVAHQSGLGRTRNIGASVALHADLQGTASRSGTLT